MEVPLCGDDLVSNISMLKCHLRILNITFHDHITNQAVKDRLTPILNNNDDLLTVVKKHKLKWYGLVRNLYGKTISKTGQNLRSQKLTRSLRTAKLVEH